MKVGDVVVSISTMDRYLTKDKQYTILDISVIYGITRIVVKMDSGESEYIAKYNFITLEEFRERKLNKIL